jgi:hypothetical protein
MSESSEPTTSSGDDSEIIATVLIADDETPDELVLATWHGMVEAAALYEHQGLALPVGSDANADRVHVHARVERIYGGRATFETIAGLRANGTEVAEPDRVIEPEPINALATQIQDGSSAPSSPTPSRMVDQRAVIAALRVALAMEDQAAFAVAIVDRPIHPPSGFRYLIWDSVPGGVVVSIATLDPHYWGELVDVEVRAAAVKRRVRAALASVFGTALGLVRCENPSCYLYADVDRVTTLDYFRHVGEEHQVAGLTGWGYDVSVESGFALQVPDEAAEPMM